MRYSVKNTNLPVYPSGDAAAVTISFSDFDIYTVITISRYTRGWRLTGSTGCDSLNIHEWGAVSGRGDGIPVPVWGLRKPSFIWLLPGQDVTGGICNFPGTLLKVSIGSPNIAGSDEASVSNGSSFGAGRFYRSTWQQPYPTKNGRFFMRTITLRPQILKREFSVWYIKYGAPHSASFGDLRFLISSKLSKW